MALPFPLSEEIRVPCVRVVFAASILRRHRLQTFPLRFVPPIKLRVSALPYCIRLHVFQNGSHNLRLALLGVRLLLAVVTSS